MNSNELLQMKFDNEEREEEYRRGYLDGFYGAIQSIELIGNLDKNRIFEILQNHWFGSLQTWAGGDTTKTILPPGCFTTCVYCGNPADEIDHVHPRSKGGSNKIDNLVPACHSCNMSKRDKLVDEWRNGR